MDPLGRVGSLRDSGKAQSETAPGSVRHGSELAIFVRACLTDPAGL